MLLIKTTLTAVKSGHFAYFYYANILGKIS